MAVLRSRQSDIELQNVLSYKHGHGVRDTQHQPATPQPKHFLLHSKQIDKGFKGLPSQQSCLEHPCQLVAVSHHCTSLFVSPVHKHQIAVSHQCTSTADCSVSHHCTSTADCSVSHHCTSTAYCSVSHHCTNTRLLCLTTAQALQIALCLTTAFALQIALCLTTAQALQIALWLTTAN